MPRSQPRKVTTIQGSRSYTIDYPESHELLDSVIEEGIMDSTTKQLESILNSTKEIEKQIIGLISEPRKKIILSEIHKIRGLVQEVIGQME